MPYKNLKSPEAIESARRSSQKYENSPKGKAFRKKYRKEYRETPKGREVLRRIANKYNGSPTGRNYKLKHDFNISLDDYNKLMVEQNGVCAGCLKPFPHRNLGVDHNHKCCSGDKSCGKCIRGLLCVKCNATLGMCEDSIPVLKRLIVYLEKYQQE